MRFILSTLLLLSLFACSGNDKSNVDRENKKDIELGELADRVHHCSRLEVAEYTMLKIVSFSDSSVIKIIGHSIPLPGERKLMIPLEAKMKVFVDLNYVTKDDITVDSTTINISLPSPKLEVYSTKIDNEKERKSVSWYRSNFSEQEREKFIQQGRKEIDNSIPSIEIAEIAKRNTEKMLQPILNNLGYQQRLCITFKETEITTPTLR